jgi:hypothetical protein
VLSAIEFDDQSRLATDEIDNERTDQRLAAEMRTGKRDVMAQPPP